MKNTLLGVFAVMALAASLSAQTAPSQPSTRAGAPLEQSKFTIIIARSDAPAVVVTNENGDNRTDLAAFPSIEQFSGGMLDRAAYDGELAYLRWDGLFSSYPRIALNVGPSGGFAPSNYAASNVFVTGGYSGFRGTSGGLSFRSGGYSGGGSSGVFRSGGHGSVGAAP